MPYLILNKFEIFVKLKEHPRTSTNETERVGSGTCVILIDFTQASKTILRKYITKDELERKQDNTWQNLEKIGNMVPSSIQNIN